MVALTFSAVVVWLGVCLGVDRDGSAGFQVADVIVGLAMQLCLRGVVVRMSGASSRRLYWMAGWVLWLLN